MGFGDFIIYNTDHITYDYRNDYKETNGHILGVILKSFKTENYIDAVLRNYLTTNGVSVPYNYINKEKYIKRYIFDLFKRYSSKYIRTS